MLESKDGDDFRKNCGELPTRLQQAVEALEALVPTGTKLYLERADHAAKQQWEHKPSMAADKTTGEKKETRNAARRRRNKKMAALERELTSGSTKPSDVQHGDSPPPVTPEEDEHGRLG